MAFTSAFSDPFRGASVQIQILQDLGEEDCTLDELLPDVFAYAYLSQCKTISFNKQKRL